MKNLAIILLLSVCTIVVQAQTFVFKSATGYVADTVINTATKTLTLANKGTATTTTVQFQANKISGTGAGTASLLASVDGVNYRSASSTTFTLTDVASQGVFWTLTGNPYSYYRISVTGSGTESMRISGVVLSK